MKLTGILVGAVVLATAVWVAPAWAEEPSSVATTPQPMSPEDAARMRQELRQIAEAMGMAPEQQPAQPAAANGVQGQPAAQQKTVADVADRALDLVNGLVVSVSQTLEKVAPEIWRIMVRQQYAKAFADVVVPWSLLLMTIIYSMILKKKWQPDPDGRYNSDEQSAKMWFASIIPMICGVAFCIWGVIAVSYSIKYLLNPEYYAVRDILLMILNPAQAGQ